jgi:ATP-dependent helicase/nuclease subunit B
MLQEKKRDAVRGHANYLLSLNDCLRRSVIARWSRGKRLWSSSDGIIRVTDATRPALAAQRLGARPYSLSALQRFAVCPYQFLLSAVHRLEPAERPEPLQRMDPLTRGSLFHQVQAEFFRALEKKKALPLKPARLDTALALLDEVLDRVAEEYREQLAPAIERVWRDETASIRADLHVWAGRMAGSDEWVPELFEFAFGLGGRRDGGTRDPRSRPDPVTIDGRSILRGSVDLVERRADGARRVTDHKTGRNRSKARMIIDGGRVLQPVLYGLAVEEALGATVVSGRLYYCTAAGGFAEADIPLSDEARRAGLEALEIVDRAIEVGFLPPAPDTGACAWCDFRPVCGPDEEWRVTRKAQEPLGDLRALRSLR